MKHFLSPLFLLIIFCQRVDAGDYQLLLPTGTDAHPLVVDLESNNLNMTVKSNDTEAKLGYLRIVNINPLRKNYYSIKINQESILPVAFDKPQEITGKEVEGKSGGDKAAALAEPEDCKKEKKQEIDKLFDGKVSLAIATLNRMDYSGCEYYVNDLIERTERNLSFHVAPGVKTTIEITRDTTTYSTEVSGKTIEWVTHVGFTFAANKNKRFYSKEIAAEEDVPLHYEVAAQNKRSNLDYGATVLFTYPLKSWGTLQVGPTAGLAADSSNIAVVLGASAVFNHNIVITAGIEVKQFDDLNALYFENQDLGDKAIDTKILNEKQFKVAPMISIGYKFK